MTDLEVFLLPPRGFLVFFFLRRNRDEVWLLREMMKLRKREVL